jgi:hypothetical protein
LINQAKAKYDNCADEYERVRTGDRRSGKSFGFKGGRLGAQHEDELQRRVATADLDYANKVQTAKTLRQELVTSLRPQAVKVLQEMLLECDSCLTLQLQKYGICRLSVFVEISDVEQLN